jgi:hypothetical protein
MSGTNHPAMPTIIKITIAQSFHRICLSMMNFYRHQDV